MIRKGTRSHDQASLLTSLRSAPPSEWSYSGDKPNPHLREFVDGHVAERPYIAETDHYDRGAFAQAIETTKATAIYNMHTYWSKKPHDAIRQYIRHYTDAGDLVLDPFCGSGGTALAALLERRKAVAIDLSPAATFIASNHCNIPASTDFRAALEYVHRKTEGDIRWLYSTCCDRCDGPAMVVYTVYSQVFRCEACFTKVPLFDAVEATGRTADGKPKRINACPTCHQRGRTEEMSTRGERFGEIPVMTVYQCTRGCKPKRAERRHNDADSRKKEYFLKYDLAKLEEIDRRSIPYWTPQNRMMNAPDSEECWGVKWRAGTSNFQTVAELYTKRNLWAIASVLEAIKGLPTCRDEMRFVLTSNLLKCSRMMAHNSDGIGRIQKGTYYVPQVIHDVNVWQFMEEAWNDMLGGYKAIGEIESAAIFSTSDARSLDMPSSSVDYIFTDPPYGGNVQYGELNFVWEAWLGFDTSWQSNEIVVNEVRGRTEADWAQMLKAALAEAFRVLKPGRCISLCYHDTSEGTWELLQDTMAEIGFVPEAVERALYIDSKTKTTNQYFGEKVNKRDLVINYRKPKPGIAVAAAIGEDDSDSSFPEKVRKLIVEFLGDQPGTTSDRIYDYVVSHMVRAGQMQAHDFSSLLSDVAESVVEPVKKNLFEDKEPDLFGSHEVSRWYLKATQLDVIDSAESAKEDHAADKLRGFIQSKLNASPWVEGIHYSDLFEHFLYAVQEKPRRPMAEWLLDYFYKTETGTFRLPATDEEAKIKAEGRSKGTSRRIKRYLAFLEQGVAIPTGEQQNDSTLADWIRHAKLSGMYEAGKMLFERGGLSLDRLSEEKAVNVEEDYQVCVRMLSRQEKA